MANVTYSQNNDDEDELPGSSNRVMGQEAPMVGEASAASSPNSNMPNSDFTKSNFVSAKKIIDKNKGSQQADLTQPYRDRLSEDSQKIGQDINAYKAGLSGEMSNADQIASALPGAISSGNDFDKIRSFLAGTYNPATFNAGSEQDYTGLQSLGTQSGVRTALKDQAKKAGVSKYGQGMSALDAAVFQSDPNSREKIYEANKQLSDVRGQREAAKKEAEASAAATKASIDARRAESNKFVNDKASELKSQASKAAASASEKRKSDMLNSAEQYFQDQMTKLLGGRDQEYQNILNSQMNYFNPNKYVSYDVAPTELYNAEQADEYNKIMDLLGNSQRVSASDTSSNAARFNREALKRDMDERVAKAVSKYQTKKDAEAEEARKKKIEEDRLTQVKKNVANNSNTRKRQDQGYM